MASLRTSDGLAIEVLGDGDTTIITLHGGLGLDRSYMRPLNEDLSSIARVVAYDQRGNGQSELPPGVDQLTMDGLIEDIEKVADATDTDRFVLLGHSYGGFIALEYATQGPSRLDGLILASTAAHIGHPPNVPDDATPESVEAFGALFAGPMASDDQWRRTWEAALPLYAPDLDVAVALESLGDTVYRADGWNQAAGLLAEYNTLDALSNITAPTLVIGGGRDFLTGVAGHEELHAGIEASELVMLPDAAHFPFLSDPTGFASAVRNWLHET